MLFPIRSARCTVPPSVDGNVKSGALLPALNVDDGGAPGVCANNAAPTPPNIATRLLIIVYLTKYGQCSTK